MIQTLDTAAIQRPLTPGLKVRGEAKKVAQQFEEFFARQMVKSFREASILGDEEGGFMGQGIGSDTYTEWFDEHMAHHVTSTSRLGIADVLMRDFERYKQIPSQEKARMEAIDAIL